MGTGTGGEEADHVEIHSVAALEAWLDAHGSRTAGVWLVLYKKHVPDRYVAWPDVVDALLCFGWIDSRTRRLDEDRTVLWICPRKAGSVWSRVNKDKIARLEADGRLRPAGRARVDAARADGSWTLLDAAEAGIVPDDLAAALDAGGVRAAWDATRPSARKVALTGLVTAKTSGTRARRIAAIVEGLR